MDNSEKRSLHFTPPHKKLTKGETLFVQFMLEKESVVSSFFFFWQLYFRATTNADSHLTQCRITSDTLTDTLDPQWPRHPSDLNKQHSLQRRSGQRLPCQTLWCVSAWFFSANSWVAASSPAISTAAILRHASSLYCGLWGNLKGRLPQFPTPPTSQPTSLETLWFS